MNHFTSIGFPVYSHETFDALLPQLAEAAQNSVDGQRLAYHVYTDNSGAQVWLGMADNQLVSAEPFFQGQNLCEIILGELLRLDGGAAIIQAEALPKLSQQSKTNGLSLVFSAPDADCLTLPLKGQAAKLVLTAFAEDIMCYEDSAAYQQAMQQEETPWALPSFLSGRLWGKERSQDAYAALSGTIIAVEQRTNALSGESFYWLAVETVEYWLLDVVADIRYFQQPPKPGEIIRGLFWLAGRILR